MSYSTIPDEHLSIADKAYAAPNNRYWCTGILFLLSMLVAIIWLYFKPLVNPAQFESVQQTISWIFFLSMILHGYEIVILVGWFIYEYVRDIFSDEPVITPQLDRVYEPLNLSQWIEKRHSLKGEGYVYILHDIELTGYYKIGRTFNPYYRMKDFGVKLPVDIDLVHIILCNNPIELEAKLHRRFRNKRKRGEWFALTVADLDWIRSQNFAE